MRRLISTLVTLAVTLAAGHAQTPGWPQFGGPTRDFVVRSGKLADSWPEGGPRRLWARDLGEGYSAIASAGGMLYTMLQRGEKEVVIAMNAKDGSTAWEYAYTAPITVNMSRAPGPRATPLVVGDALFTVGATGRLHRIDRATGRPVWSHDLFAEFNGHVQDEYYAASPLPYRDTLIVPVGAPGAAVMALDQRSGAVVWKAHDFRIAYASPILIDVDGQPQAVLMMETEVVGIDPRTGRLLWQHPHANATKTNVSTPVWGPGNLLFCSSAYNSGSRVLELTRRGDTTTVREVWYGRDLRIHVANAVRIGDTVYGSSGDFGPVSFVAVDFRTGSVRWQERGFRKASFVYADGKFILLNEDGELLLASPRADGLQVLSKAQVLTATAWTPPSLVGTTLYVRDRKQVVALDLAAAPASRP